MTVTLEKPEIVTLLYQQEKTDEDYGSCLWARFYFDLKNYTLTIESDCGNYSYGWCPTPNSESFLKLCCRINEDYLLSKISCENIVAGNTTWQAVKALIDSLIEDENIESLSDYDWEEIESACYCSNDERDVYEAIISALNNTELYGKYDDYDIYMEIKTDYPNRAKKIVSVFSTCIQPFIKTMECDL